MLKTLALTGILQCNIEPGESGNSVIQNILIGLPDEARLVDRLHITLVRQQIMKSFNVSSEEWELVRPRLSERIPLIDFGERTYLIERGNKRSWIVLMRDQFAWRRFVNKCMTDLGLPPNPEPYRVYHVSIANLTGNPFDSVGDVDVSDMA